MKITFTKLRYISRAIEMMGATVGATVANVDNARTTTGHPTDKIAMTETLLEQPEAAAVGITKIAETFSRIITESKLLAIEVTAESAKAGMRKCT